MATPTTFDDVTTWASEYFDFLDVRGAEKDRRKHMEVVSPSILQHGGPEVVVDLFSTP